MQRITTEKGNNHSNTMLDGAITKSVKWRFKVMMAKVSPKRRLDNLGISKRELMRVKEFADDLFDRIDSSAYLN